MVISRTAPVGADFTTESPVRGSGGVSQEQIDVVLRAPGAGEAVGTRGGRRASGGTLGTWVGYDVGFCGADGQLWSGDLGPAGGFGSGPLDFTPAGVLQVWQLYLPDGSLQGTYLRNQCLGDPLPSPPPDATALLEDQADAIPGGDVSTSPHVTGLVGVENWFWYEGPLTVQVSAALDGWVGTTTAVARELCWDFGDGAGECSPTPGSEADPAVTHTYTRKGTKQIVLTIVWEAAFTLTGPAGVTVDAGIGTVADPGAARAYVVEEREAVIVG